MKFSDLLTVLARETATDLSRCDRAADPDLTGLGPIDAAAPGQLSFVEAAKTESLIAETQASAVILPVSEPLERLAQSRGLAWVAVPQPKELFALAVRQFYQPFQPAPGIHPTAVIDPSVKLGQDVSIGAYTVIQAGVTLGDRACLHPHVVVYPQATIGPGTLIHAQATIHERTEIGPHCTIHSGAVIGAEGFGFVPTAQGWLKLEQTGRVVLEAGVSIGCGTTIDRPAMGETRIGQGAIIDNLVHIGHGCTIGAGSAIAAQAGLAGGVSLGKGVILAGQVGVANAVKIGDRAIATSKSGLHHDVPAGETVSGYPAISNGLWLRASAVYRRLPDLHRTLNQIQKQLRLGFDRRE